MPAQMEEETTAPAGELAGEASATSPRGPAPRSGNGVAGDRFARTKEAVEAQRFDAEGALAWSHVLRTPEEIGATQGNPLGRLLRRLFRIGGAAQPTAGAAPAEGATGGGRSRPAGFGRRRPSRAAPGGRRSGMAFVLALGTGALVTSLLFGGMLGLPDDSLTPKWVSWPFGQEDRQTGPPAGNEVVIAGVPEVPGQGGPEITLESEADGSSAGDVGAPAAGSEPAVSDLVTVAGSAQDAWRQYYRLGHRLHAEGDLRGAVEMYKQAAALEPDDADMFYDWARALQLLGERNAAIAKYRAALELAPESATGADARARLAELQAH